MAALAAPAIAARAQQGEAPAAVKRTVERFARLPSASCLVVSERAGGGWRTEHDARSRRFVGSAVKTFILAQFLRDVEAGRLSEDRPVAIDDGVRSLSSPVFLGLAGTTPARSVLEAMIAHSDNTATDAAMALVGVDRIRGLIKEAGLAETQIVDSTRRLFSYLAGAADGVDVGWDGMQKIAAGDQFGPPRAAVNDRQTMMSTAEELVRWYRLALRGEFFGKPETLREFKRIQATATALSQVVPGDVVSYGKGGSIDWNGFHAVSLPGQMIVDGAPTTFCFTINWTGEDGTVAPTFAEYREAVAAILAEVAR
ncbi:MAG: serine hydrolase [Enhydrobacter sp.]|nr:MAG: serine hydrolase [Enhydrobacter sp.]